jgi:hypothetical protein
MANGQNYWLCVSSREIAKKSESQARKRSRKKAGGDSGNNRL